MSPLQLEIEEIATIKAIELNNLWHSRLPNANYSNIIRTTHKVCFGAKHKNYWFAVSIWTNPIAKAFNGLGILELRRMAIHDDSPKNTASRFIKINMIIIKNKFPDIWKLISYQDTEVHNGTIYKASGWKAAHVTQSSEIRWGLGGRERNKIITKAPKIRWEKQIRPEPKQVITANRIEKERSQLKLW